MELGCLSCGVPDIDWHHVKTRRSGGTEEATNLVPLCRYHHNMWHQYGARYMYDTFPIIEIWIDDNGWYFDGNKLRRDNG